MVVVADEEEEWTGTESRGLAALGSADAHFGCGARFQASHVAQAPDVDRVQSLFVPVVLFFDQRHPPPSSPSLFTVSELRELGYNQRNSEGSNDFSRRALWRKRRDVLELELVD